MMLYRNGVLYAGYQDGSNFKPQHWLTATGLMTQSVADCFAENDPHTSATTPPTTNPTTPSTLPPAGANYAGSFDGADCNQVAGWVLDRNTPNQSMACDVYINGQLVAHNLLATGSRQDVANAYGIAGYSNFGFSWRIPDQYKSGKALNISIKYAGTNTNIPGSPKTTTACPDIRPYTVNAVNPNCDTQTARFFSGSEPTQTPSLAHTGAYALKLSTQGPNEISTLTSKLMPIRKNDSFTIGAYAYSPVLIKRNLTPQIASAIAGGLATGFALTQQQSTTPDQRQTDKVFPAFGLSAVLMMPLVKSLLDNQQSKASLDIAFYDESGKFVYRQRIKISKSAREGWVQLQLKGHALQDGYMVVRLKNQGNLPIYFDDIAVQVRPGEIHNSSLTEPYSKLLSTRNGFASQLNTNEQNIYRTNPYDDCGNGGETYGAIITGVIEAFDSNLLFPVDATPVAWAAVNISDTAPTNQDHNGTPSNDVLQTVGGSGQQTDQTNQSEDPYHVNSCELRYLVTHPLIYEPLSKNRSLVEDWLNTHGMRVANSDGDSPYNAIKHALYQALNVCQIGIADTRAMAERHEICNGQLWGGSEASIEMDTFNNNVGIELPGRVGCNFDLLVNAVITAFSKGDLHKLNGVPTP